MTKELFQQITEWQKKTFPNSTAISKIIHLREEIEELRIDVGISAPDRRLEFADCFFLLFGAAAADGMTYEDVISAIEEKFSINKARKWGKQDENGVVKHIEG